MLKSNRNAALFYIALYSLALILVSAAVTLDGIPYYALGVFLTLPVMAAVACGMSRYKKIGDYERVMALATMAEFAFMLILVLAFL